MNKLCVLGLALLLTGCVREKPAEPNPARPYGATGGQVPKAAPGLSAPRVSDDPRVPALIEKLQSGFEFQRFEAATALGEIGPPARAAVPALGLGRLGPAAKAAVPTLATALKSGTPAQRVKAVAALGKMGPAAREAVPALIEALQDKETDKRLAADRALPALPRFATFRSDVADALGDIGADARPALPALRAVIQETTPNPDGVKKLDDLTLYEAATRALKKIDPVAAEGAR
jgi:HEAT repeat protein